MRKPVPAISPPVPLLALAIHMNVIKQAMIGNPNDIAPQNKGGLVDDLATEGTFIFLQNVEVTGDPL